MARKGVGDLLGRQNNRCLPTLSPHPHIHQLLSLALFNRYLLNGHLVQGIVLSSLTKHLHFHSQNWCFQGKQTSFLSPCDHNLVFPAFTFRSQSIAKPSSTGLFGPSQCTWIRWFYLLFLSLPSLICQAVLNLYHQTCLFYFSILLSWFH